MSLRKKLGAGFVLLVVAVLGYLRTRNGHSDPITIDNPRIRVHFGVLSHRMKIEHPSGSNTKLSRDITKVVSVDVTTRDGEPHSIQFGEDQTIAFEDSADRQFTVKVVKASSPSTCDQLVLEASGQQFGDCGWDSGLLNRCTAFDDFLRIKSIRFRENGNEQRYCLNKWEQMDKDFKCSTSGNGTKIVFGMKKDDGSDCAPETVRK